MKIYLAERYSQYPQLKILRHNLEELGHSVTSSWLDIGGNSFTFEELRERTGQMRDTRSG